MKNKIVIFVMAIALILLSAYAINLKKDLDSKISFIETEYVEENGTYVNINRDKEIKDLKNENKALYDSLAKLGSMDNIQTVIEYRYIKKYKTDTVFINTNDTAGYNVFHYFNNTDTLNYSLTLCSKDEPKWYLMEYKLSDKFTIINRNENGINQTTITPIGGGTIEEVTVFNKSRKEKILDKFSLGAQVGVGYGLVTTHKIDAYVGVGLSYKLK
jgi:hypothetical protein